MRCIDFSDGRLPQPVDRAILESEGDRDAKRTIIKPLGVTNELVADQPYRIVLDHWREIARTFDEHGSVAAVECVRRGRGASSAPAK